MPSQAKHEEGLNLRVIDALKGDSAFEIETALSNLEPYDSAVSISKVESRFRASTILALRQSSDFACEGMAIPIIVRYFSNLVISCTGFRPSMIFVVLYFRRS